MCRLLGWLGRPRTLAELLLTQEHGLLVQSWAPRRQVHGTVNADGWGVAWWSPAADEPARWRSTRPLWHDAGSSFGSVARHVSASAVVASVRSATVGMPVEESATAPFTRGPWALTHNGVVDVSAVPPGAEPAESRCDSAVLAAHLLDEPTAVGARTAALAATDPAARLTTLLGDGERLLGVRWADTLCWRVEPDGVLVASEPCDDRPGWHDVPDRHQLTVTPDGIETTPLEEP